MFILSLLTHHSKQVFKVSWFYAIPKEWHQKYDHGLKPVEKGHQNVLKCVQWIFWFDAISSKPFLTFYL